VTIEKLIEVAHKLVGKYQLSNADFSAGTVGAALLTAK